MIQFINLKKAMAENPPYSDLSLSIKDGVVYIKYGKTIIYKTRDYSEADYVTNYACDSFGIDPDCESMKIWNSLGELSRK